MKFLVEMEDQLAGIAAGIMVIAFTEKYFKVPYSRALLIASLALFFIFLILDIIHNFADIGGQHVWWLAVAQASSLVDIGLVASLFSWLTKINIPVLSENVAPYFENPSIVAGVGFFFVASSVIWLVLYFAFPE